MEVLSTHPKKKVCQAYVRENPSPNIAKNKVQETFHFRYLKLVMDPVTIATTVHRPQVAKCFRAHGDNGGLAWDCIYRLKCKYYMYVYCTYILHMYIYI